MRSKRFLAVLLVIVTAYSSGCTVENSTFETSAWSSVETTGTLENVAVTTVSVPEETTALSSSADTEETSANETAITEETFSVDLEEPSQTEATEITEVISDTTSTTAETTLSSEEVTSISTMANIAEEPIESSLETEATSVSVENSDTSETTTNDDLLDDKPLATRVVLDVKNVQQLPELPAGCEITSTTIVLNYLGFDVTKMELMEYMPIMKSKDKDGRWESPWNVFVGSPEYSYYGCYSPVIRATVDNYFGTNQITGYEVVDLKNSTVTELYDQIDAGNPVLVWATIKMGKSKPGNSWILQDGSNYTWVAGEHCLVLIGYDLVEDTVILSDPYDKRGTVEYPRETFAKRYEELFSQALVIKKSNK